MTVCFTSNGNVRPKPTPGCYLPICSAIWARSSKPFVSMLTKKDGKMQRPNVPEKSGSEALGKREPKHTRCPWCGRDEVHTEPVPATKLQDDLGQYDRKNGFVVTCYQTD